MATMEVRIRDLATRVATECKAIRTLTNNNAADLSALTTTAKSNLVAAINELDAAIGAMGSSVTINDATSNTTQAWSSSKIAAEIQAAKDALTNGAASALDTLAELATALGGDANFAATTATALGNRVRYDASQVLNAAQKTQACANIGIGEPDTDFVTVFTSGLT